MTAAATTTDIGGSWVSVVFRHIFEYARTEQERAELARLIVDEPPALPCRVYVWDRPCLSSRDDGGPAFPTGRLDVVTGPSGWVALNHADPSQDRAGLVDSLNPDADEDTPAVLFDPEGDVWFPASASLPRETAYAAVVEFMRTGQRPDGVQWQPGQWQ